MASRIEDTFNKNKALGKPTFVTFITAGFPTPEDTIPILLGLQKGGADIIELGIPHSDPIGEGPTIQHATDVALKNGITTQRCLQYVIEARAKGVTVPIILMGYYNPIANYGEEKMVQDAKEAGADGFIVVDLPPEESDVFRGYCKNHGVALIQLVAMTTTNERLKLINQIADGFVYCISVLGVTGARKEFPPELGAYIKRVRSFVDKPLAIGFGVSSPDMFRQAAALGDGVVVGSEFIKQMEKADPSTRGEAAEKLARSFVEAGVQTNNAGAADAVHIHREERQGERITARFGNFGGRFAPETLIDALDELEIAYAKLRNDPDFQKEIESFASYVGRPTPLYFAERLSRECGGAQIWLKREDLAHTGAHKINNALGQALIAKRLGKTRIIAETGAGQHGVATATVCAKLGLECIVYMGAKDVERQSLNVFRMKMLGAKVVPVYSGSQTLKDAVNEAMRDWVTNIRNTHYIVGSAIGPHPFPTIVRDLQSVIGKEARAQTLEKIGRLPDYVLACVGGGSNAIGTFHPFIEDKDVQLIGIEAAGRGVDVEEGHCATVAKGKPGVLHGTRTLVLQNHDGQISDTHSISAGLDYPGVGPEHAWLADTKRATYVAVSDQQALEGLLKLSQTEGIIPALETAHAVYYTIELAKTLPKDKIILLTISGRGDKDMGTVAKSMGVNLTE